MLKTVFFSEKLLALKKEMVIEGFKERASFTMQL